MAALFLLLPIVTSVSCRAYDPVERSKSASRNEKVAIPGTQIWFDMVSIPGGRIRMERSGREVTLLPFWISKHEVTWGQFDRFYEFPEDQKIDGVTRPSAGKNYLGLSGLPPDFLESGRPVTNLRIHSALVYCEWLTRKTGKIFRLPTEAEWEFACRAASEEPTPVDDYAWHEGNSEERTHPAGLKKPNSFGVFDMLGNVWEYCLEPDHPPDFGPVLRGGAWNTPADRIRTTPRKTMPAGWSTADPNRPFSVWWFRPDFTQGFRVVRVPETATVEERERYALKIEVANLAGREHLIRNGKAASFFSRVTGEVRNTGGRVLDELAIKVYYLDPEGKPHLEDVIAGSTRRATFNVAYPVLVASAHKGAHAQPLGPGESRNFAVDVPLTFDPEENVREDRFGANVLHLRFSAR